MNVLKFLQNFKIIIENDYFPHIFFETALFSSSSESFMCFFKLKNTS